MGPPGTVTRRMRIALVIRELMMKPMSRHPRDWAAFQRHRSAKGQEIFNGLCNPVRAVSMQAVVTQADAKTDRQPIKKGSDQNRAPGGEKQRRNGARMQNCKRYRGRPIDRLTIINTRDSKLLRSLLHAYTLRK